MSKFTIKMVVSKAKATAKGVQTMALQQSRAAKLQGYDVATTVEECTDAGVCLPAVTVFPKPTAPAVSTVGPCASGTSGTT